MPLLSLFLLLLGALASSDRWRCQSDSDHLLCRSQRKSAWATDVKHCLFFLNMWPHSQLSSLISSPPARPQRQRLLRPLHGNSHCEKTQVTPDCSSATNGTAELASSWGEHLSTDYNRSTLMLMRLRGRSGFMCSIRMQLLCNISED